jgi:hypothetical protein
VLLEADVEVDPVRPQVHIVHIGQVTLAERVLLGLPGLGQLGHHRRRQPLGRAEELTERGHEVPGRQTVQVQQRQHLGDLRGLARPRRQDRRGEPLTLARVGSMRLSLTRGIVTSTGPAVVVTCRGWW